MTGSYSDYIRVSPPYDGSQASFAIAPADYVHRTFDGQWQFSNYTYPTRAQAMRASREYMGQSPIIDENDNKTPETIADYVYLEPNGKWRFSHYAYPTRSAAMDAAIKWNWGRPLVDSDGDELRITAAKYFAKYGERPSRLARRIAADNPTESPSEVRFDEYEDVQSSQHNRPRSGKGGRTPKSGRPRIRN